MKPNHLISNGDVTTQPLVKEMSSWEQFQFEFYGGPKKAPPEFAWQKQNTLQEHPTNIQQIDATCPVMS